MRYGPLLAADGEVFDYGMAVFFPGPASATGEDCVEFHVHGGKPVVAALFGRLAALDLSPAEPGEFTKRAFLNGKVDLVQAEAIADVIAADTEAQRRFASGSLEGRQSRLYAGWRKRLVHARAMIEAELDFADEGDVPGSVAETVWDDMEKLLHEIERHSQGFEKASILRDGFEVVILGAPNAGKSSLLNALAQRDVAIVSEEAGTTRDFVEVQLDLSGIKVRLVDTAGLRDAAQSSVERLGIERARSRAATANLILYLIDLSMPDRLVALPDDIPVLKIGNKVDLINGINRDAYDIVLSAASQEGVLELLDLIARRAEAAMGNLGDVLPSRERHVRHLQTTSLHIGAAMDAELPLELRAEELRLAGSALGRITGEIGTEEVLGAIFSAFCVGK